MCTRLVTLLLLVLVSNAALPVCDGTMSELTMMQRLQTEWKINSLIQWRDVMDAEYILTVMVDLMLCQTFNCDQLKQGVPWGSTTDYCQWQGVICASEYRAVVSTEVISPWIAKTAFKPLPSNIPDSSVVGIFLLGAGIEGTLPDEFYCLPNLRIFELEDNPYLVGDFKGIQGQWSYVGLGETGITGEIPSWPRSNNINFINYLGTKFSGTVPTTNWEAMGNLGYLSLGHSDSIHGILPQATPQAQFLVLVVRGTSLSGGLPAWVSTRCSAFFGVSNYFTGNIVFSDRSILSFFDVGDNELTGSIPSAPAYLLYFDASRNKLTGQIPETVFELQNPVRLMFFMMQNNDLTGNLPQWSNGRLVSIQIMILSNNNLNGTLPEWQALTRMEHLFLSENDLTGTLPVSWATTMPGLSSLGIWECSLSGTIPSAYGGIPSLSVVWLQNNFLSGSIPNSFADNTQYSRVDLMTNMLSGTIPAIRSTTINLGNNKFSGSLNPGLFTTDLQELTIENNDLTGDIPREIVQSNGLTKLWLFGNRLGGTGNPINWNDLSKTSLIDLSLAGNQLFGELSRETFEIDTLENLDLGDNQFSGTIPLPRKSTKLRTLSLSGNNISGEFPYQFFRYHDRLNILRLDNNKITGTLRGLEWDGSLQTINVKNNKLTHWVTKTVDVTLGILVSLFSVYPSVYEIDISGNNLQLDETQMENLNLPLYFPTLTLLNFGGNKGIRSRLPESWKGLTKLSYLNVSDTTMHDGNCTTNMTCLPSWLTRSVNKEDKNKAFSCYTPVGSTHYIRVDIDDEYFNKTNCLCKPGYYGEEQRCSLCLANADCPGNEKQLEMVAVSGYFGVPDPRKPVEFKQCLDPNPDSTSCVVQHGLVEHPCKHGYTGRLCGACADGFTRYARLCVECPASWSYGLLLAGIILVCCGYLLFLFRQDPAQSDGTSRVAIFYIQMMALVSGIGVVLPSEFGDTSSTSRAIFLDPPALSCLLSEYQISKKYTFFELNTFTCLKPIIVGVVMIIIWSGGSLYFQASGKGKESTPFALHVHQRANRIDSMVAGVPQRGMQTRQMKWSSSCIRASILLLITIYPAVVQIVINALNCSHDSADDKHWLEHYPTVECYTYKYNTEIFVPVVITLLVIVIGQPCVFFCLLVRGTEMQDDPEFVERYGALYYPFRESAFFWEVIAHARRFVVVALINLPPEPAYRYVLIFV